LQDTISPSRSSSRRRRGSDLRQDQRLAEGRGCRRNARCAYSDLWTVSSTPGERMFDAELHRLHGELLLDSEHLDTVENAFQRTLAIARRQESRLWGLRVAVSLARLAMTASTSLRPMGSTQCGVLPVGLSLQKHTRRVGATCEGQDCRRLVADAVGYRCAVGGELGLECAMFGRAVRALHALVNNNDTAAPGVPVSLHTLNERWPGSALPPRAGTCRTAIGAS
jgi:hypothetical protein